MEAGVKDLQPATGGRPTGFGVTTPAAFQRLTPARAKFVHLSAWLG